MFGALIVAAGKGSRMKNDIPKQFLLLRGKHVILHTLESFFTLGDFFKKIVVVVPPGSIGYCREVVFCNLLQNERFIILVEGGEERQDSVFKGLLSFEDEEIICIHDGVRPFVSPELIKKVTIKAKDSGAVIPVLTLDETLKEINGKDQVLKTWSRDKFRLAQTPQCFQKKIIMKAYQNANKESYYATDDAALVERMGSSVLTIQGEKDNIKLTTKEDFALAEKILERRVKNVQGWDRL